MLSCQLGHRPKKHCYELHLGLGLGTGTGGRSNVQHFHLMDFSQSQVLESSSSCPDSFCIMQVNDDDDRGWRRRRRTRLVSCRSIPSHWIPLSQSQPHHHIANNAWICAIDLLNYCFDRGRYTRSTPLHITRCVSLALYMPSLFLSWAMEKCI